MKSKYDFPSGDEYIEYLRAYYVGQAITSIVCMSLTCDYDEVLMAKRAVNIADAIIENLLNTNDEGTTNEGTNG